MVVPGPPEPPMFLRNQQTQQSRFPAVRVERMKIKLCSDLENPESSVNVKWKCSSMQRWSLIKVSFFTHFHAGWCHETWTWKRHSAKGYSEKRKRPERKGELIQRQVSFRSWFVLASYLLEVAPELSRLENSQEIREQELGGSYDVQNGEIEDQGLASRFRVLWWL